MLEAVKLALRITGTAFDSEINALIADCQNELAMLGIYDSATMQNDAQIQAAVTYYCKARFGDADNAERWEAIYRDKVSKLQIAQPYGGRETRNFPPSPPDSSEAVTD